MLVQDYSRVYSIDQFPVADEEEKPRTKKTNGSHPDWMKDHVEADAGAGLSNDPDDAYPAPTLDLARELLVHVPADNYNETWMPVGAALNKTFGEEGRAPFHEWSSSSAKYNERDADKKYTDFAEFTAYNFGTLVYLAKQNGWEPPPPRDEEEAPREEEEEAPREEPSSPLRIHWTGADEEKIPEPKWLIKNRIPEAGVGLLSGQWGTAKTSSASTWRAP